MFDWIGNKAKGVGNGFLDVARSTARPLAPSNIRNTFAPSTLHDAFVSPVKTDFGNAAVGAAALGRLAWQGGNSYLNSPKTLPTKGQAWNAARKFGGFVADEALGVDDFRRSMNYAGDGNWMKAAKSLGAGALELGSTFMPAGRIARAGVTSGAFAPSVFRGLHLADKSGTLNGAGVLAALGLNLGGEIIPTFDAARYALDAFGTIGEASRMPASPEYGYEPEYQLPQARPTNQSDYYAYINQLSRDW
jgi:hypothetical protein